MSIKENILKIREEIEEAKSKVGRTDDVLLLAVTKTVDYGLIDESLEVGIEEIAENKVQELLKRMDHYEDRVKYHLIGSLQTNKVKNLMGRVKLIHSLDRLNLANEIDKRAKNAEIIQDVLIEVNAAKEESKAGIYLEDLDEFVYNILEHSNIRVRGLMTMAPFTDDEAILRETFRKVYEASERIKAKNYENIGMDYLSMGMTNDYKIAIEEGSNIIRVGTGIYGRRNY